MAVAKEEVIAWARKGLSAEQIAKLNDVSRSSVQRIINEAAANGNLKSSTPPLTHKQRSRLRKKIADYVASGKTTAQAARHFGVKESYIGRSIKEHGVEAPDRWQPKVSFFKVIVTMLENPGRTEAEVARLLKVSRQYVNQVLKSAHEAGLFETIERVKQQAAAGGAKQPREVAGRRR